MRIAVVGATGALGQEVVAALAEEANAPEWGGLEAPLVFASKESVGESLPWLEDEDLEVEAFSPDSARGLDLVLIAAPDAVARDVGAVLRGLGVAIVDASRGHREKHAPWLEGRPLDNARLVPLPSAEGLMLARVLRALEALKPVWVRATVLKAASGAGGAAVTELGESTAKLLNGLEPDSPRLPHRLAFNVIPQAGAFSGADDADEQGLVSELPALVGAPLQVAATVGYGPWFYGHFADITVGFESAVSAEAARAALREATGVKVLDEPKEAVYPMPSLVTGDDDVHVGRLRADPIDPKALRLVASIDNVRASAVHAVAAMKAVAKAQRNS